LKYVLVLKNSKVKATTLFREGTKRHSGASKSNGAFSQTFHFSVKYRSLASSHCALVAVVRFRDLEIIFSLFTFQN